MTRRRGALPTTLDARTDNWLVPAGGFGEIPNSYFDHLYRCLSHEAFLVVGQVLRRTRWGDAARGTDQRDDWFDIRQNDWAERLGISEGGLRMALREAENCDCLIKRKVGREVQYACRVECFLRAKLRRTARAGNPHPGRKSA